MSEPLRIALIGFGQHVRRSVLRLFDLPDGPRLAAIVVRDPVRYAAAYPDQAASFTADLDAVLADPGLDAVYVATPLASHGDYASRAIQAGKHVLCEKPLTASLAETRRLLALADRHGVLLGEIAMYRFHAQFAAIRQLLADKAAAGVRLVAARARFTIPELPAGDIRYNPELGGGALFDVGYYPLTCGPALFGAPRGVVARGYICPQRGVDLSGSAQLDYGDFAYHAVWAIGAAYSSMIELSFTDWTVLVERAFAKPVDLATSLAVTEANGQPGTAIPVPADDHFAQILRHYTALIRQGDRAGFAAAAAAALRGAEVIDAAYASIRQGSAQ